MIKPVIVCAILAGLLPIAFASNTSAEVMTTATFHCISVAVPFEDSPATTCGLRYRIAGSGEWRAAHYLDYDKELAQFRGSIVNLAPKTQYEIQIALPDSVFGHSPAVATATTRDAAEPPCRGRPWHVSPDGNDSSAGTPSEPFRSIQHAVNQAQPGDKILIHAGTYTEQVIIKRSGTAEMPIWIAASPGEIVTLDGDHRLENAFKLTGASHVIISGIQARNTNRSLVLLERGCSDITIQNMVLTNPGSHYYDSGIEVESACANTVLRNNHISFTGGKYSGGRMGITLRETNGGHIVYNNVITGNHLAKDGIGGGPNFGINGGPHKDSDIYGNKILGFADDGIEAEGGGINVRIWDNRISDCLVGLGLAPVIKGPCYVWRNVIVNCGPAFKLGEGDHMGHGPLYLFHNTSYSTVPEDGGYAGSGGKGLFQHVCARNNLLSLAGRVFYDNRKQLTNSFDYDLLFTTNPKRFMAWGKGHRIKLDDARALGFWRHGIVADPKLTNPPDDLTLQSNSPAIDAGVRIPNFNDNFKGRAPDIGAFEH